MNGLCVLCNSDSDLKMCLAECSFNNVLKDRILIRESLQYLKYIVLSLLTTRDQSPKPCTLLYLLTCTGRALPAALHFPMEATSSNHNMVASNTGNTYGRGNW